MPRSSYLPARRKRPRSRIVRGPRREFKVHEAYVRRHECSIPNCPYHDAPVEFAHIGPPGSKGEALKAFSWWGVAWCQTHHKIAHSRGHETMCREAGTTLEAQQRIALNFAKTTTDKAMRAEMQLWEVDLETGAMASAEEVLFNG